MDKFFLTDQDIQTLIDEPKKMNHSAALLLRNLKAKKGKSASMLQNAYTFPRSNGSGKWCIYLRRNRKNPFDFSCGLGFIPEGRKMFILIRYNGKSHEHSNRLEKQPPFYDFHIHRATEKYQKSSYKDEHYATCTDRYANLEMALNCLLTDCQVMDKDFDDRQESLLQ